MSLKPVFDHRLLEETAEDLYDNAPCGYLSTLPDGTIVKVNRTFLMMTDYKPLEILDGCRFQDLLSIGGQMYYETHLGPLLQMQGFAKEICLDLVCKSGRKLPVLTTITQKHDGLGKPLINRVTVFDITDRKKYERELLYERQKAERAARAKADFLSMMSHEIRTPMNAVIGISHLLEGTELTSAQREYTNLLKTSSENLMNLLNDILDFSKIESGRASLEERNFELGKVARDCVTALQGRAVEKGLDLRLELDSHLPAFVVGDPVKIGQVLTNLVSNAVKFTEKGSVDVRLTALDTSGTSASVLFEVIDTGIGISLEKLVTIFDEFTQADYEIGVVYGGSGLGLAISKKLIEMHGSKISVHSKIGVGSVFSFELNLPIGHAVASHPSLPRPGPAQLAGLRILVAEDNVDNVFLLEHLFKSWGLRYEIAGDGQEAVQKAKDGEFDLILMDLRMPFMNGYQATNAIRAFPNKSKGELPIIAFSASTKVGEEDLVELTPFNDTIGKPFRPEELFSKIAYYARGSDRPKNG